MKIKGVLRIPSIYLSVNATKAEKKVYKVYRKSAKKHGLVILPSDTDDNGVKYFDLELF